MHVTRSMRWVFNQPQLGLPQGILHVWGTCNLEHGFVYVQQVHNRCCRQRCIRRHPSNRAWDKKHRPRTVQREWNFSILVKSVVNFANSRAKLRNSLFSFFFLVGSSRGSWTTNRSSGIYRESGVYCYLFMPKRRCPPQGKWWRPEWCPPNTAQVALQIPWLSERNV